MAGKSNENREQEKPRKVKDIKLFHDAKSDLEQEYSKQQQVQSPLEILKDLESPSLPTPDEFKRISLEHLEALIDNYFDWIIKQTTRIFDSNLRMMQKRLGIRMNWCIKQEYNEKGLPRVIIEITDVYMPALPHLMRTPPEESKTEFKPEGKANAGQEQRQS